MLVIGIAGGTGSGKTTVFNNILQQLNAEGVMYFHKTTIIMIITTFLFQKEKHLIMIIRNL